jgi:hypothetical protein
LSEEHEESVFDLMYINSESILNEMFTDNSYMATIQRIEADKSDSPKKPFRTNGHRKLSENSI